MRILHVLRAPVGGLFRHVLDLSSEQSRLGHDVGMIVATSSDGLTEARLRTAEPHLKLGIHRVAMSRAPGISDVASYLAVRRQIKALEIDVVHGHGAKGGAYARMAGAYGKPRIFYTPHGGSLHYPPGSLAGRVFHTTERLLEQVTNGLIFESAFAATAYDTAIGSGPAQRRVIHNGLRPSDFAGITPSSDAADLLFIGEMRELKGVEVLLRATARLEADYARHVTAVLVGGGPDRERFEVLARELGLEQRVRFAGAMPAADAFRLARTVVVPSLKESLPYVVLEAAAAGRPVVATDVGGIPEIVAGTDTPLVPAGDDAALAAAIEGVLASPAAAQDKAHRLKSSVAERFTVERMAASILDFYTEQQWASAPTRAAVAA